MSTVMGIKAAIEQLSPVERVRLHTLVWPEEREASDTPPGVREKLAEAGQGGFTEGTSANVGKMLNSLQ